MSIKASIKKIMFTKINIKRILIPFVIIYLIGVVLTIGYYIIYDFIANPNYKNYIRSKVSRVHADMQSLATALEAYYDDNKSYPSMRTLRELTKKPEELIKAGGWGLTTIEWGNPPQWGITTPVAYITSMMMDPFYQGYDNLTFVYYKDQTGWILISPGPDFDYDINPIPDYDASTSQPSPKLMTLAYDTTNGTISDGDIYRVKQ